MFSALQKLLRTMGTLFTPHTFTLPADGSLPDKCIATSFTTSHLATDVYHRNHKINRTKIKDATSC